MKVVAQEGQKIVPLFVVKAIVSFDHGKRWLPVPPFHMEAETIQDVARMFPPIMDGVGGKLIHVRLCSIDERELTTAGQQEEQKAMRQDIANALYLDFFGQLTKGT